MLCLSRKTDYALIALGHIAERPERVVSAREISEAYELPTALLMNILKTLHKKGVLQSTRGVKGGYKLAVDLARISLHGLIQILEGKVQPGCDHDHEPGGNHARHRGSVRAPIQALHYKLMQFLHDVNLADLIQPGRRIDVPIERLKGTRAANSVNPVASGWRDVVGHLIEV